MPFSTGRNEFDYIVIGSGAGGGPLAANLALAGFEVLLLEAGGNPAGDVFKVPAFHAQATEDPEIRWDFRVRNDADRTNVWYPRAAAVGGCTIHNAMITIAPPDSDWNYIAAATSDNSWRSENMRRYFVHLENCRYRNGKSHGSSGWLSTEMADFRPGLRDPQLLSIVWSALKTAKNSWSRALRGFDPNDVELTGPGLTSIPLATKGGRRNGPREFVERVMRQCPNLTLQTGRLATRILFNEERRAVGVDYAGGDGIYWSSPKADRTLPAPRPIQTARVSREVILCAGAFNSPQLLLLSGLGDRRELKRHGIEAVVDLPGVGKNLQDHYEVSLVYEMKQDFRVLRGALFDATRGDAAFDAWQNGKGIYTSSGVVLGINHQSSVADPAEGPDLFIFGAPADFRNYSPGYSKELTARHDRFTWTVLKARMGTAAGSVSLRSANPLCPPEIDFAYFPEGDPAAERDLDAIVEGVQFVDQLCQRTAGQIKARVWPQPEIDSSLSLKQFIRGNSWGHHASCSNRMGLRGDPASVVDSRFRVFGAQGLRIVDASVFPRIPGHFVSAAIYMISEKAVDDILEDAGRPRRIGREIDSPQG